MRPLRFAACVRVRRSYSTNTPDSDHDLLRINFDITVPHVSCNHAAVDIDDVLGCVAVVVIAANEPRSQSRPRVVGPLQPHVCPAARCRCCPSAAAAAKT